MSMSMVCDEMGAIVRKFWGRAKADGNNEVGQIWLVVGIRAT